VAEDVVHRLEAIEVDEMQRQALPIRLHPPARQPLCQRETVRQVGEAVVMGEVPQPVLGRLALGDVDRGGQHRDHLARRVP